jgi:peptidoglycan hydrolase-like protein with peptidoglycan-binding domain
MLMTLLSELVHTTAKEPTKIKYRITDIIHYTPKQEIIPVSPETGPDDLPPDTGESAGEANDIIVGNGQGTQRTLKLWSRGSDVRALQKILTELGFPTGKADGIYGSKTYKAVVKLQKHYRLKSDGTVGAETRRKLAELGFEIPPYYANEAEFPQGFTRKLSTGKAGMDVRALQTVLIKLGYLQGRADQVFGQKTRAAVRKFQREHEMMADGIAGVEVLRALFPDGLHAGN